MQRMPWTPNHWSEQPCRMVIYDTESHQTDIPSDQGRVAHSLRLGVASVWTRHGDVWSQSERLRFWTPFTFWEFVRRHSRNREPLWVYAHNAAFDASLVRLWDEIDSGRLRIRTVGRTYRDPRTGQQRTAKDWCGRLALDNLPFIVEAKSSRGMVKMVDTLNYIPMSLDKLAAWVGMEKYPLPGDLSDEEEWWNRCERDVDITTEVVLKLMKLWRDEQLGTWQPTIAGLAYSSFRHLVPDSGIVTHGDEQLTPQECYEYFAAAKELCLSASDVSRIERRSYYGGRVYPWFIGDVVRDARADGLGGVFSEGGKRPKLTGPVYCLDVNGLYAWCLRECQFPVELMATEIAPNLVDAELTVAKYHCIADVTVSTRKEVYPYRQDGRTIYVRGAFTTTLCGSELREAFRRGHVKRVHTLLIYHADNPFKDYVDYWWGKRLTAIQAGDECTARLCKLMVNSLYGKLGQRKPLWANAPDVNPPLRWGAFLHDDGQGEGFKKYRVVAGMAQRMTDRRDCRHTFTAAAAFCTMYGRRYMDCLREICPERTVLYQDTDSLFVLEDGFRALVKADMIDQTECGKLKIEGVYNRLSIYGPKNYDVDGVTVAAGLRGTAVPDGLRRWQQWYFERCNSLIARQPDGTVHSWQSVFIAPGSTPGFSVHEDGWTVAVALIG